MAEGKLVPIRTATPGNALADQLNLRPPADLDLSTTVIPVILVGNPLDLSEVDVSDRAARLLGVADVSDRAARLLGVVDVSDEAGRVLGRLTPGNHYANVVFDANVVVNPGANAIIATTGDLPAGTYEVTWGTGTNTLTTAIRLRVRDAADAVVEDFMTKLDGSNPGGSFYVTLVLNQDIVIQMDSALTGTVSGYVSCRRLVTV